MILLFGSTGYIGSEFKRQLEQKQIQFKCWPNAANTTFSDLEKWYKEAGYPMIDTVINAAGYTGKPNVDACIKNKDTTIHANIIFTQILTDWCMMHNFILGSVSTGCIYIGNSIDGKGFSENDESNFSFKQESHNIYSGVKVMAEKIVSKLDKFYIWRLRMPFEEYDNPRNLLSKYLRYNKILMAENSISNKNEFVSACIESFSKKIPYGTYNITNPGSISSQEIIEKMKKTIAKNKNFELINDKDFYQTCASLTRSNCILNSQKILDAGIKMRSIHDSIDYCLNNWKYNE